MTMDDEIFQAICDWKEANKGSDPTLDDLAKIVQRGKTTIRYHIHKMVKSGRIRVNKGFDVGGKWIPPGSAILFALEIAEAAHEAENS